MKHVSFLFLAVCLASSLAPLPARSAERPNLLIFIADDVSAEDIGCYGNAGIRTPNIDRIASEGLRFDRAFLTCSSCSPSRCSLMTGRYPHSTGAKELHQPLPADQVVFPGLLKAAGYYTAAAGKWHLGPNPKSSFDLVIEGGGPSGSDDWLPVTQNRPKDKPFFLYFAAHDAHRPYPVSAIAKPHELKDVYVPPYFPDTPEVRGDLALYYDEIGRFDENIGRVVEELKTQGVLDDTVILIMADNGRPFPRCKTTVLDSGIRTPFVVRWPGAVKQPGVCRSLVSSVDIAPTFCELAGVAPSPSFQGVSFVKLLTDTTASVRDFVFAEHNWHDYEAHERSVSDGRYLFLWNARPHFMRTPPADAVRSPTFEAMIALHKAGALQEYQDDCFTQPRTEEEFYDKEADPNQLRNRITDSALAEQRDRLRDALHAWQKQFEDTSPDGITPDKYDRWTGLPLDQTKKKGKKK